MIIHGALPKSDPALIKARVEELAVAFKAVSDAMHKFDGTQEDATFGGREMAVAFTHLQTAHLWAQFAVEKN